MIVLIIFFTTAAILITLVLCALLLFFGPVLVAPKEHVDWAVNDFGRSFLPVVKTLVDMLNSGVQKWTQK